MRKIFCMILTAMVFFQQKASAWIAYNTPATYSTVDCVEAGASNKCQSLYGYVGREIWVFDGGTSMGQMQCVCPQNATQGGQGSSTCIPLNVLTLDCPTGQYTTSECAVWRLDSPFNGALGPKTTTTKCVNCPSYSGTQGSSVTGSNASSADCYILSSLPFSNTTGNYYLQGTGSPAKCWYTP